MAFLPYPKGIGVSCHKVMKILIVDDSKISLRALVLFYRMPGIMICS